MRSEKANFQEFLRKSAHTNSDETCKRGLKASIKASQSLAAFSFSSDGRMAATIPNIGSEVVSVPHKQLLLDCAIFHRNISVLQLPTWLTGFWPVNWVDDFSGRTSDLLGACSSLAVNPKV